MEAHEVGTFVRYKYGHISFCLCLFTICFSLLLVIYKKWLPGAQTGRLVPGIITGDVVEEGLGLVIVAVGTERVALVIGVTLAVLSFHTRVALIFSIHRFFRLLSLLI